MDSSDVAELTRDAEAAMTANRLVWTSGPEEAQVPFGGPPSSPPMISVIRGVIHSQDSGHSVLVDAGDLLWFWQDARHVAIHWHELENLTASDRSVLQKLYHEGGQSILRNPLNLEAHTRLKAAGLISLTPDAPDTFAVEITLLGRRFLHWGL